MYTCKKCGKDDRFRTKVEQSVDCTVSDDGFVEDVLFEFSDAEVDKTGAWCDDCGEAVKQE